MTSRSSAVRSSFIFGHPPEVEPDRVGDQVDDVVKGIGAIHTGLAHAKEVEVWPVHEQDLPRHDPMLPIGIHSVRLRYR